MNLGMVCWYIYVSVMLVFCENDEKRMKEKTKEEEKIKEDRTGKVNNDLKR